MKVYFGQSDKKCLPSPHFHAKSPTHTPMERKSRFSKIWSKFLFLFPILPFLSFLSCQWLSALVFLCEKNILRDREYNQSINQSNVDYKKMIYQIRIHVDRYVYALWISFIFFLFLEKMIFFFKRQVRVNTCKFILSFEHQSIVNTRRSFKLLTRPYENGFIALMIDLW